MTRKTASQQPEVTTDLRRAEQQKWLEENREALEAHNRYIEEYGLFSYGRRRF